MPNFRPPATRTERDTFGPIEVPADRLWGAQTQRSLQHFDISGERMAPELLRALAQVKRASAYVNRSLGLLDAAKTTAIVAAADEVIAGCHADEFPLVVWQTGSGTQYPLPITLTEGPPRAPSHRPSASCSAEAAA